MKTEFIPKGDRELKLSDFWYEKGRQELKSEIRILVHELGPKEFIRRLKEVLDKKDTRR